MTRSEEINGSASVINRRPVNRTNPYQPVGDFVSNVSRFKIIESTLREGEQFANAFFDTEIKIKIAKALDDFGVDYIELTSPAASEQSRKDCEAICKLGLKAKILTHIRCTMEDARIAVETGVDGLDVVIGTSHLLREFSHGKDMEYITKSAIEVINFIKSKGLEVRFSSEDSFRSDLVDLLSLYRTVDRIGVNRVGIADTVGCATPRQVYDLVRTLRGVVSCDIEIHLHDDTGCAIANAYCALEAGATHIDTSVIGIGERNGITSLGGLMARMIVADRDYVTKKYNLHKLKELEDLVAEAVQVNTPFNNPITGFCAFTHKAGIHAKAILNNPSTYEIINPADFGLTRYVHFASRLTGWNAVKTRVGQLGLSMTDEQVKVVTQKIKALADVRPIAIDDADSIIRTFHLSLAGEIAGPAETAENEMVAEDTNQKVEEKGGVSVLNGDGRNVAVEKVEPQLESEVPVEVPVVEAPVTQATAAEIPPAETPTTETPAVRDQAVETPAVEIPAVEAPAARVPEVEASVPAAPAEAIAEIAVEVPAVKITPAETPTVETQTVEVPTVENPSANIPESKASVVAAPAEAVDKVAVEDPAAKVAAAKATVDAPKVEAQTPVEFLVEIPADIPTVALSTVEPPADVSAETAPVEASVAEVPATVAAPVAEIAVKAPAGVPEAEPAATTAPVEVPVEAKAAEAPVARPVEKVPAAAPTTEIPTNAPTGPQFSKASTVDTPAPAKVAPAAPVPEENSVNIPAAAAVAGLGGFEINGPAVTAPVEAAAEAPAEERVKLEGSKSFVQVPVLPEV